MKRLISFILPAVWVLTAFAAPDAEQLRTRMRALVSEGNRCYDRSYRAGIKAAADSLEAAIAFERLSLTDSLEFTADLLKLRADWHYENGNFDPASFARAEELFHEALGIYRRTPVLQGNLRREPMIYREQAQLAYRTADYAAALDRVLLAIDAYEAAYANGEFDETDADYLTLLDLYSQAAICRARLGQTDAALESLDSLAAVWPKDSPARAELMRKRGKVLLLGGGKSAARKALPYYKDYFNHKRAEARSALAGMTADERTDYWMRLRPFVTDCMALGAADPAFLYDVNLFAKGLLLQLNRLAGSGPATEAALRSLDHTWRDVRDALPADGAAIEFAAYPGGLGAIVLTPRGRPQWVDMMPPADFFAHKINGRTNSERIYSTAGRMKNALYNDSAFYSSLWTPALCRAIGPARRVYFAPDGYLHQIAIEYMLPPELEGRDMFRLTSTRRLLETRPFASSPALIVGGVRYNATVPQAENAGNDAAAYDFLRGIHASFAYLDGSLAESDSIAAARACDSDSIYTGEAATERTFRAMAPRFPVLTISTHGYFGAAETPQGTDLKPCLTDESLSQSILVLAGANSSLRADGFDSGCLDGILSARELGDMDLSGVGLAVISACQTGLGYVTADGVYGLQRGLKNAGVGAMVVSQWSVSDDATSMLMTRFHRNLADGFMPHEAFKQARASMLTPPPSQRHRVFNPATMAEEIIDETAEFDEPQYRDAFILIDAL